MQVIFQTKSQNQNRYSIRNIEGHGRIFFDKGVLSTTDKDLIDKLINHPLFRRGDYQLVTNEQRVEKYLKGEDPDKLTQDILDKISRQGIKELGQILGAKSEQPTLIKTEVRGLPITDAVQDVIDYYAVSDEDLETVTEDEEERQVETFSMMHSTDMNAKEAIEHIEETELESLGNFITDEEDRKTVLKAWEDKLGE